MDRINNGDKNGAYSPLTKSIDIDEALMLIELSREIHHVAAWKEEAIFRLPQPSRQRRQEIVSSVQRMFLTTTEDEFAETPLRSLLALPGVDERCKRDLLFVHYLRATPLVWKAICQIVLPRAEAAADPLAAEDAAEIPQSAWDEFLERYLQTYTDTTFSRTRAHITAHLTKFGLLENQPVHGDRIARRFFARFYEPDPRAFWLSLAQEFAGQGTASRSQAYVMHDSWTRIAYCTKPSYARYVLDDAERKGLITTSYFGSEKQVTFRGGDPVAAVVEVIRYG